MKHWRGKETASVHSENRRLFGEQLPVESSNGCELGRVVMFLYRCGSALILCNTWRSVSSDRRGPSLDLQDYFRVMK